MFLRGKVCGLTALSVAQSPPHLNKICGHIDQYKLRNVTIQILFGTVMKEEKCNYWFLLDCIITFSLKIKFIFINFFGVIPACYRKFAKCRKVKAKHS